MVVRYCIIIELIPGFALYRGMYELASYAQLASYKRSTGLTFPKLSDPGNGMVTIWIILLVEWMIMIALTLLAERVRFKSTKSP